MHRVRALAATALVPGMLLLAGCGGPPGLVGTPRTVVYCGNGGVAETMDVYEPQPAPAHPVPAVVDVHGGGWVLGDATLIAGTVDGDVEAALVGRGWVFISINYRLAPGSKWPAQIEDAMCAVRYVRAHAGQLHVDPARIGALGASAGGQLVSLLGLAGPQAGFSVGPYLDQSSRVQAVVDQYGPADLTAPDWASSPVAQRLSPEVFGVPVGGHTAVLVGASPVTYVAPGAPPFLVVQGAEDTVVPPTQSTELVRRLTGAGNRATLIMVQHAGHGLVPTGGGDVSPSMTQVAGRVVQFFTVHLGGQG